MNGADQEHNEELASLVALNIATVAERSEHAQAIVAAPDLARLTGELRQTVLAFAQAIPLLDPPGYVRERILKAIGARVRAAIAPDGAGVSARPWLMAAAVLLAAGLTAALSTLFYRGQVADLRDGLARANDRAAAAEREVVDIRRTLGLAEERSRVMMSQAAVLMAPDMARIDLGGQAPVAPSSFARAFWSRNRGMVFAAEKLPATPVNKVYQLWVITAGQPPISAGLLAPDQQGSVTAFFSTPPDIPAPVALAVTLEPAGGVPAPTGEKYLVGLTGL